MAFLGTCGEQRRCDLLNLHTHTGIQCEAQAYKSSILLDSSHSRPDSYFSEAGELGIENHIGDSVQCRLPLLVIPCDYLFNIGDHHSSELIHFSLAQSTSYVDDVFVIHKAQLTSVRYQTLLGMGHLRRQVPVSI